MSLLLAERYCGDATSPTVSILARNIAAHFSFSEGSDFLFQKCWVSTSLKAMLCSGAWNQAPRKCGGIYISRLLPYLWKELGVTQSVFPVCHWGMPWAAQQKPFLSFSKWCSSLHKCLRLFQHHPALCTLLLNAVKSSGNCSSACEEHSVICWP